MSALVIWPSVLGLGFLFAGLCTYRKEIFTPAADVRARLLALGPAFIAAALAAFSGEHFTQAQGFSALVPKWLPLRVPIVYVVGVALLAAALSLVARRCLRWSTFLLGVLFALFVLLIYLPAAAARPGNHVFWIFPFREGSYALGGFCMFMYWDARRSAPFALFARVWTAGVLIFYGVLNILYPQFSPGVPDARPTSAWVPAPHVVAYVVGGILVALGAAGLLQRYAVPAITWAGIFMTALTVVLFVPDLFLANGVPARIEAINFVADTLLFAGTMLVIARTVAASEPARVGPVARLRTVGPA